MGKSLLGFRDYSLDLLMYADLQRQTQDSFPADKSAFLLCSIIFPARALSSQKDGWECLVVIREAMCSLLWVLITGGETISSF